MPLLETIFFYVFAIGVVIASSAVVLFRSPLYSAIALIGDFFFFAGLYVLLSAHFMAVVQILVYAGAIMVLFIFIIMLLNLRDEELGQVKLRFQHAVALAVSLAFFAFSAMAISNLFDHDKIEQARQVAAQTQASQDASLADGEDSTPVPIRTTSAVPSLFADLNEAGLNYQYDRELASLRDGTADPAARKYRPFDSTQKFETPPMYLGVDARGGQLREPVSWGTIEPLSLLLVNRFVVPFELTALLLLAAIIGAVIIAKKRL